MSSSLSSLASLVPGQPLGLCCSHETLFGALEPDRRLGPFFRVFLGLDLGLKLPQCGAPQGLRHCPQTAQCGREPPPGGLAEERSSPPLTAVLSSGHWAAPWLTAQPLPQQKSPFPFLQAPGGAPLGGGCGCLAVSPQRWAHMQVVFKECCLTPQHPRRWFYSFPVAGTGKGSSERCRDLPRFPGGPGMCPVAEWGSQVMVWPVRNIVTGWAPLHCQFWGVWAGSPGDCPLRCPGPWWAFHMLEGRWPQQQPAPVPVQTWSAHSWLRDKPLMQPLECPAVSGIAEPSTSPPGRLRPLEGPDCLPSSAPMLRTWRVGPGAPSHGNKERCALSPILMPQ